MRTAASREIWSAVVLELGAEGLQQAVTEVTDNHDQQVVREIKGGSWGGYKIRIYWDPELGQPVVEVIPGEDKAVLGGVREKFRKLKAFFGKGAPNFYIFDPTCDGAAIGGVLVAQ